jgi:mannose-6-phosphate isomerase-like protein (cupin superfamily)
MSSMRKATMGTDPKGWIGGSWNWDLPVEIGYTTEAIDEPHRHRRQIEAYLVASGTATALVDGVSVPLSAGDVLVVEPHEVRSFTASSADYRCFVLHAGGDGTDDKELVSA